MKVLGIITEYNPFHNGHLYHLRESVKLTGADYVVCVMSGNFIQRGEPAIINKWARAKMALNAGINLVIEIPTVYAMSSAEHFAFGAVKILDSLNIVDCICFGSESGDVEKLSSLADIIIEEKPLYKAALKNELSKGVSYPKAREAAIMTSLSNSDANSKDIIKCSNNILGIEYIKALKRLDSSIIPFAIKRIANEYNCREITGEVSSATAIREILKNGVNSQASTLMPDYSFEILKEEFSEKRGPVTFKSFQDILLMLIRKSSGEYIKSLNDISEGLENRIKDIAGNTGDIYEFFDMLGTRRFTNTRLQRVVMSFITGLTKESFNEFNKYGGPQYARVLGFDKKGRHILKKIKKKATIPVIIKRAHFSDSCNNLLKKMLELELKATDVYVLGYENPLYRKAGQEYTQEIVIND
jgi:predicted nucleotidyltransferase